MGLLEGIILILVGATVAVLAWVAKKVSEHDGNDRVLATKVSNLGEQLGRVEGDFKEFRSETRKDLSELGNNQQEILRRLPSTTRAA